jgi:hypothetical protein
MENPGEYVGPDPIHQWRTSPFGSDRIRASKIKPFDRHPYLSLFMKDIFQSRVENDQKPGQIYFSLMSFK